MKPIAVLIVVDTETGGLNPAEASMISIAAQVVEIRPCELEPGDSFERKIQPDRPVHPKAAAVNGYTPESWTDAAPMAHALIDFVKWVDGVCKLYKVQPMWAGCNPLFDLKFFKSDCSRSRVSPPEGLSYRVIDVQSLCLPLLLVGEVPGLGLKHLRAWAGCEGEQTHTAMGDVEDTCQVVGAFLLRNGS